SSNSTSPIQAASSKDRSQALRNDLYTPEVTTSCRVAYVLRLFSWVGLLRVPDHDGEGTFWLAPTSLIGRHWRVWLITRAEVGAQAAGERLWPWPVAP
ncbi:hypothetical protein AB0C28_55970, partial [Nonomuraea sp. NPDC048892]|uniref:hypothetical protein n=1 Tax=Nonomuraea sp. NPDC048892 TaxID=3154624 RepID=UPI0033E9CAD5